MSKSSFYRTFQALKRNLAQVQAASYQNIDDAIAGFYEPLRGSNPLGAKLDEMLPIVDFDAWYKSVSATGGSMVGSARLTWPRNLDQRLALQRELLRRIVDGEMALLDFSRVFTYVSARYDDNNGAFTTRVVVPFFNDLIEFCESLIEAETDVASVEPKPVPFHFIHPDRIAELKAIQGSQFDLTRLIQLATEVDICYANECYLAVAALTRAIIDHVPPIFGSKSFSEVANNYTYGGKSFKEAMQHLANSARKVGDSHLHVQMRAKEILPNATQVNFARELDMLLSEIVRIS